MQKAVVRQRLSNGGWPENVIYTKSPVHAIHISKPVRGIDSLVNDVKNVLELFYAIRNHGEKLFSVAPHLQIIRK